MGLGGIEELHRLLSSSGGDDETTLLRLLSG